MAIADDFAVPAGQYPPFAVVTEDDHRAWIIVTTALGLACALVFAGIRTFVRCAFTDGFGLDDAMVYASTVSTYTSLTGHDSFECRARVRGY